MPQPGHQILARNARAGRGTLAGESPSCLLLATVVHSSSMGASPEPARATLEAPAERELAVDERQREADRASLADEREYTADERERQADARERTADAREQTADNREQTADDREAQLDERQRQLDERERSLNERAQRNGVAVDDLQQRVLANIERSRALLARTAQRLDRQEAGLRRAANYGEREQAEISRESAEVERRLVSALPDPSKAVDWATETRARARNAIASFAAAQEEIARINEQLAARLPDHHDEYQRIAGQARETARKALEVLPVLTD
jgi:hypothetical protein